jgi:hypothetical protein
MHLSHGIFPLVFALVSLPTCLCAQNSQTSGTLRGQVIWAGERPPEQDLPVDRDRSLCGSGGYIRFFPARISNDGSIQGALVTVMQANKSRDNKTTGTLSNRGMVQLRGCQLEPRMQLLALRSTLIVEAMDEASLDVAITGPDGEVRTLSLPTSGARQSLRLNQAGVWLLRTPTRPWAWSCVLVSDADHGAVTDSKGRFLIPDLAPGNYTVQVWHAPVTMTPVRRRGLVVDYQLGSPQTVTRLVRVRPGTPTTLRLELGK